MEIIWNGLVKQSPDFLLEIWSLLFKEKNENWKLTTIRIIDQDMYSYRVFEFSLNLVTVKKSYVTISPIINIPNDEWRIKIVDYKKNIDYFNLPR